MGVNAKHIYKFFSGKPVLQDVSFSIEDGEIVGLLGPNGAGKTTLMRILLGLLAPTPVKEVQSELQCPVSKGYLSEKNPLYETMYVREYLSFMMSLSHQHPLKDRKAELEKLIEMVGLTSEANKKLKELSKGYRQRVGLAQAIMDDPALLILDEPTTGLDPNQIGDIRALIKNLATNNAFSPKVIILSTHILQEVKEMCSRVIILDKGHIKVDKPISEIGDLNALFESATRHE